MKRTVIVLALIVAGSAGLIFAYFETRKEHDAETETESSATPSRVEQAADGASVLKLDAETQKRVGLQTALPVAGSVAVELTATARVMDGATLAAQLRELRSAQTALDAARADFERKKQLFNNGQNASASALEQSEATMKQQQLAVDAAGDRTLATWGQAIAGREDLGALARSLLQREAALVRVELLATDKSVTAGTIRLLRQSGEEAASARLLGPAPATDSVIAGQSLFALVMTNAASLVPGTQLVARLDTGRIESGTVLPRMAVVRYAGLGWAYVQTSADNFTRRAVLLDRAHPDGWLVTGEWTQPVVIAGAQSLLSEELKGNIPKD